MKLPDEIRRMELNIIFAPKNADMSVEALRERILEAIVRDCTKTGKRLIEEYTQDQEFSDNWEKDQLARFGLTKREGEK